MAPEGGKRTGASGGFSFLKTEEAQQHLVGAFEKDGSRRSVDQVLTEMAGDSD